MLQLAFADNYGRHYFNAIVRNYVASESQHHMALYNHGSGRFRGGTREDIVPGPFVTRFLPRAVYFHANEVAVF